MIQEHTYRDASGVERKQTDWGGTIVKGSGGVEGIAVAFMVFAGAVIAGGLALLWFAITGYKKFHFGTVGRLFALALAIAYGVIVYTTFASGKPDLMILVYANIPIAIFFVIAYIWSKRDSKYVKGTVDIAKSTANSEAVATAGKGLKKLLYITKLIFLYIVLPLSIFAAFLMYSLQVSVPALYEKNSKSLEYANISKSLNKSNFKEVFTNNISKKEQLIDEYDSLFIIRVSKALGVFRILRSGLYYYDFPTPRTIEGFIALQRKLKEEKSRGRVVLTDRTLENIIDNLGNLDKGYSKKLAELIRNNSNPELFDSYSDKRIETTLKKYNQMSALTEYKRIQSQYK